ncbi:MAG: parallel beta-helix domain-containing protein [Bacteroidota bacterium]
MRFLSSPKLLIIVLMATTLLTTACKDDDPKEDGNVITIANDADAQANFQEAMIDAEDGAIIELEAGTYTLDNTISLDGKTNITIRGAGRESTMLNFEGQSGAEGLKIDNCNNILMHDFQVLDTKGDGIKAKDCNGITFLRVGAEWSGDIDSTHGAYGLYPVLCTDVLMDDCYARGASDAGIYVGQSDRVIVRNSLAEYNVAGIEIENTLNADVYDNTARNNTGGLLIFDLPGLVQKNGAKIRCYRNTIIDNNTTNFAPAGNSVGQVPPGTGSFILATKEVEFFDNQFLNNNVVSVAAISYEALGLVGGFQYDDSVYNPYSGAIFIHDNTIQATPMTPDVTRPMGQFLFDLYGSDVPEFILDGIPDPEDDGKDEMRFCFSNNSGNPDFGVLLNGDATLADYTCTHAGLPEVTVNAPMP